MSTPLRVVGFATGLAAVFGIALAAGSAVGPVGEPVAGVTTHGGESAHTDAAGGDMSHADGAAADAHLPGGLMVSQGGYTLRLAEPTATAGADVPLSFAVDGPEGRPVTDFEVVHEKKLHLIAVRRDLSGFQHVHPTMDSDGQWSTSLDLAPGAWRLYADFKAEGTDGLTLGTDLSVAGDFRPAAPAAPARTAHVDGYTVTLAGEVAPGADSELTLSVSEDGAPVTDLEPYLGAHGHLVALREGDLAYLHVHATEGAAAGTRAGPDLVFSTSVPSEGRYRLFLDFKHEGKVRTAAFVLDTRAAAQSNPEKSTEPGHGQTRPHTHAPDARH